MERNFKRISKALKLPRESRERIRSQLASYQPEQEEISMKKAIFKRRVPLLVAAIVMAAALTLTAGAVTVTRLFRNDMIVSSMEEIFTNINEGGDDAPASVGVVSPGGRPPFSLDEMIESDRFKTDDWSVGEWINGGVLLDYFEWDSVEVLSSDPTLRSRRIGRAGGAEKMEYTAENPTNLLDTLTGRIMVDLTWMNDNYKYIPDADMSYVVKDKKGNYVSEYFQALYAKPDDSGYVRISFYDQAPTRNDIQAYFIGDSYETAYYYTTPDGYEFLIRMNTGNVWVDCDTNHANLSLFGAYLTSDEVEDILDHLSLSVTEQP